MQASSVRVDSCGRFAPSGIHDAVVKEPHFAEGEFFTTRLLRVNGEDRIIRLDGVKRIGFQDVINGTIIFDIFASSSTRRTSLLASPKLRGEHCWGVLT